MAQPYTSLENTIIKTKKNIERLEHALNYIKEWSEKYTKWDIKINVKGKMQSCPLIQVVMFYKEAAHKFIELHYLTDRRSQAHTLQGVGSSLVKMLLNCIDFYIQINYDMELQNGIY